MSETHLILGVTRQDDDPKGPVTGLIYREGDKLRWGAVAVLFGDDKPAEFFRYVAEGSQLASQRLARVEYTVNRQPRFLFKQKDGKLTQETLGEKLLFSESKKALLKPQKLPKPLPLVTLAVEYLEVSRLSDVMRQEMLNGERSVGQFCEVLGTTPKDQALTDTLWELSRRGLITAHELGDPAENAIALNRPAPKAK